jgi:hydrogenase maturation protein HypF
MTDAAARDPASAPSDLAGCRWAITVRGVVQGVGFRPFVYRAAVAESLAGWVGNEAAAVTVEVQGPSAALARFLAVVRDRPPPQARIESLEVREIPAQRLPAGPASFEIRRSQGRSAPRPTIPADLATCAECRQEIQSPSERRYGYPFTNCTNCGPRWSIITALPYDRSRTSMDRFPMCAACRTEYEDPADRRFHAQPIACPACGPQLQLLTADGRRLAERHQALDEAARAVREGRILALLGIGGFQLLADATSDEAVARLRTRKRRPHKPLAVMLASLDEVRRHCEVTTEEEAALISHQAPILLLRRRTEGHDPTWRAAGREPAGTEHGPPVGAGPTADPDTPTTSAAPDELAASVAPDNPYLGVMVPYSPLHHLLIERIGRPVVCTSGNVSEEPMAITTADGLARLGNIADLFLTHDRPLVRPVDDSVARWDPTGLQVLRRARGFAPLPVRLKFAAPTILAVGGHLKNTVALSLEREVILTPHIGDLDNSLSADVQRRAVRDLVEFFAVTPEAVACDLHPDYASTRYAEELATAWGAPLIRVQHHHAHIAACMAEQQLDGPVLGLAWDGTGYGTDGSVWGGEVLQCEGAGFTRVAHLRTFPLPGGDRAAREPRRAALGLLFEMLGDAAAPLAEPWFTTTELKVLLSALRRPRLFPRTSSLGRLFDVVAVLCGGPQGVSFEGQAAMGLEFAADSSVDDAYPLPLSDTTPAVADWEPLIRQVLDERGRGVPRGRIAARFHNALAGLAVAAARRCLCVRVALSGGCFQNSLLTARVRQRLLEAGYSVYIHREVPPGDGGIALGQILIAAQEERLHVPRNSR